MIFGYDNISLIFSSLSFNSLPFNSIKYFLPLQIGYLAFYFSQYFHSYSLGFHPYILIKVFSKIYENKKIVFKWFFGVVSSFFVTRIFHFYLFTKIFRKIYENKNIAFCYLDFFVLIYSQNLFEKFMKSNSNDPYNISITHILKLILNTTEHIFLYVQKWLTTIRNIFVIFSIHI